jgi:PEP-CTERM motif
MKSVMKMRSPLKRICVVALAIMLLPALAGAVPVGFDVFAEANSSSGGVGLDTGIHFDVGDFFTVFVDPLDLWNAGDLPRWSNADGLTHDLFATGTDDSLQPFGTLIGQDFGTWSQNSLSLPFGTLVGSINGQFFAIGTSFVGVAPDSGNLLLYYWDSNFSDNTDSVRAFVDAAPVPEPGSVGLLIVGAGLLALARSRRRQD